MNQIPNIEETDNTEVEEIAKTIANGITSPYGEGAGYCGKITNETNGHLDNASYKKLVKDITNVIHQQLQKAREEERDRIWLEANRLPLQEGHANLISLLDLQNVVHHSELDQNGDNYLHLS